MYQTEKQCLVLLLFFSPIWLHSCLYTKRKLSNFGGLDLNEETVSFACHPGCRIRNDDAGIRSGEQRRVYGYDQEDDEVQEDQGSEDKEVEVLNDNFLAVASA